MKTFKYTLTMKLLQYFSEFRILILHLDQRTSFQNSTIAIEQVFMESVVRIKHFNRYTQNFIGLVFTKLWRMRYTIKQDKRFNKELKSLI